MVTEHKNRGMQSRRYGVQVQYNLFRYSLDRHWIGVLKWCLLRNIVDGKFSSGLVAPLFRYGRLA